MANPYYVDPLGGQGANIAQGLAGLGQVRRENRQERQRQQRANEAQQAFGAAIDAGDASQLGKLMIQYPEYQEAASKAFGFSSPKTKGIVGRGMMGVLASDTAEQAIGSLMQAQDQVLAAGGTPQNINDMITFLQQGGDEVLGKAKMSAAYISPEASSVYEKMQGKEDKTVAEIRKETRARLGKSFQSVADKARSLTTNYNKLKTLGTEVRAGNRTAVAQMLVSVVKLNDPNSAVLDSEMASALNAPNPLSAVTDYMRGKGVGEDVIQATLSKIDVLNPDNINVDDVLSTGKALLSANIPAIQEEYKGYLQVGEDSLSPTGLSSVLPKSLGDRIEGLSSLVDATPQSEAPPQVGTAQDGYEFLGGDPANPDSWRLK